jgi:cytochrome c-type biogenesis protein CcmI
MAYALGALVVILVLAFVVMPLVRRRATSAAVAATPSLAEQRAEIYRELTELELDQRVGKISAADYQEQSETLLARAAALISAEDAEAAAVDRQIEREIAEARASLKQASETTVPEARS